MLCTRCGHTNAADSHFCAHCGHPLPPPEHPGDVTSTLALSSIEAEVELEDLAGEDAAVIAALPADNALLLARHGANAGSRYLLDVALTTVGRDPTSGIFLDDVTVSRRHAEIRRQGPGGFDVRDLGSLNGTYLNQQRIDGAALGNGDELQIGKFKLVFYASPNAGGGS